MLFITSAQLLLKVTQISMGVSVRRSYSLQLSVNADDFDWTEYEQVEKLYILYDDYFVRV